MSLSTVSFFRELPLSVRVNGDLSYFKFAVGFSKPVDPDSGMTVNLTVVQGWMKEWISQCQPSTFQDEMELLRQAWEQMKFKAQALQAEVCRIQLVDENQRTLSLESGVNLKSRFSQLAIVSKSKSPGESEESSQDVFIWQNKFWVTEGFCRLQVTAYFRVVNSDLLRRLKVGKPPQFPVQPWWIEKENPLTGHTQILGPASFRD